MYRIMFFPSEIAGGVGSVVMNIFRSINREKFQIDFCVSKADKGLYNKEIEQSGGKIFILPLIRAVGPVNYIRFAKKILKENGPYDAVHVHSIHMGVLAIIAAKQVGIKTRIYHVHNTQDAAIPNIPFKGMIESFLNLLIYKYSTCRLACGKEAGEYIYGAKDFTVINNAVNADVFYPFDDSDRNAVRQTLGISTDKFIIGNIARFSCVKNQKRFIKLAQLDKKNRNKLLFLLVGTGDMLPEVKSMAKEADCEDKILFLGRRNDTEMLYNVMDVFCLPSFFEGLPVTLIEAQACGVPCVVSDTVTQECDLGITKVKFLSLNDDDHKWLDIFYLYATEKRIKKNVVRDLLEKGKYELKTVMNQLEKIYSNELPS